MQPSGGLTATQLTHMQATEYQQTLRESFAFEGIGLHSAKPGTPSFACLPTIWCFAVLRSSA